MPVSMHTPATSTLDLSLSRPQAGLIGLALLLGVALGACLALPPMAQKASYHAFHDGRAWLGIPNALNVLSNVPFAIIGLMGFRFLAGPSEHALPDALRPAYATLFAGLVLTGFGSAYYHWASDNHTLVWDRLPMTLAFMGLFAAVIGERINISLGRRLLVPLVALGIFSVLLWARVDDLRLYGAVQFYPVLAIPVIQWAFPARYSHGPMLLAAIGCYVVAKLLEDADGHVFALGHLISGHTLKHLAAAAGGWCVVRMLTVRRAV